MKKTIKTLIGLSIMFGTTVFAERMPLDGLMGRMGQAASPYLSNGLEVDTFFNAIPRPKDEIYVPKSFIRDEDDRQELEKDKPSAYIPELKDKGCAINPGASGMRV